MNFYFFSILIALFFSKNCLTKFTTSLTNGIIGQFSHLYTHKCLVFDKSNTQSQDIFGSCLLANNNNLFQIQYYNPSSSQKFFILSYSSLSSDQSYLLYMSSQNFYYTSSSSYCLTSNMNCYNNYYNSYPAPSTYFNFYANFSRDSTNNPLGTFTLQTLENKKCVSLDILNGETIRSFKDCNPNDLSQIFGFLSPDIYLMNQITSTVEISKGLLTVKWSNPSNIANVAYMIISGNQSISDQGTLNLQNVKCTSQNSLSPLTFNISTNMISISINVNDLKNCDIFAKSNDTVTMYEMKAIHVFMDNNVGFSTTIQSYYKNQLQMEELYLIGQTSDTSDQTQIFESSVSSFEITNQINMSFTQSIGETYLKNTKQNLTITLNSNSRYTMSLVGNSMSLISVNASNNQVLTQTLPCLSQIVDVNKLNLTFDLANIVSNYYKMKLAIKLTAFNRILSDGDNNYSSKTTVAEYNSQDIYFIGTDIEIQDLIDKQKSLNGSSEDSNDKTVVVALSVTLSVLLVAIIMGGLILKKDKLFHKTTKENIDGEPRIVLNSNIPNSLENPNKESNANFENNEIHEEGIQLEIQENSFNLEDLETHKQENQEKCDFENQIIQTNHENQTIKVDEDYLKSENKSNGEELRENGNSEEPMDIMLFNN